jgi:hypothetical protein
MALSFLAQLNERRVDASGGRCERGRVALMIQQLFDRRAVIRIG